MSDNDDEPSASKKKKKNFSTTTVDEMVEKANQGTISLKSYMQKALL